MQQKAQIQTSKLQDYLNLSNQIYQNLLGYKPEQTILQLFGKKQWKNICQRANLNSNSSGIYLPRNQTATIQDGINFPLNLFHEYFGHGLYCEQSLSGKELITLEGKLLEEEKREFKGRQFNLEDLKKFREKNKTFKKLNNFKNENLGIYEGFAVWSEYFLSKELNLSDLFEIKYNKFPKDFRNSINNLISFKEQYGNLTTFYNFGLARKITPEKAKILLKDIYKDITNIKFALLYGSKKEFSDIDLFIVSDNLTEIDSKWLDIRVCSSKELEEGVNLFDIAITDPLLTGEFILGSNDYFKKQIIKLNEQVISEESIKNNLEKTKEQKNLSGKFLPNSKESIHGLDYSETYLRNALALKQGKRILTKSGLFSYLPSKNLIELKGGEQNAT